MTQTNLRNLSCILHHSIPDQLHEYTAKENVLHVARQYVGMHMLDDELDINCSIKFVF